MRRVLFLLAAAAACGPNADQYPLVRPDATYPTEGTGGAPPGETNVIEHDPLEPWDETGAGPLTGIFAVQVRAKMHAIVDVEVRQLYRVRLLDRPGTTRVKIQLCRLVPPHLSGLAELDVPVATELLLRAKPTESEGPYLMQASLGLPAFVATLGAAGADEDGDGHPGVTLDAKTLTCGVPKQIYATVRTGATLHGKAQSKDLITGSANPLLDQTVLGVSDPCLSIAATLKITPLPGSTFTAKRTTPALDIDHNGNVTCGEIVAAAATLFP
jgi:hypothetical protein